MLETRPPLGQPLNPIVLRNFAAKPSRRGLEFAAMRLACGSRREPWRSAPRLMAADGVKIHADKPLLRAIALRAGEGDYLPKQFAANSASAKWDGIGKALP